MTDPECVTPVCGRSVGRLRTQYCPSLFHIRKSTSKGPAGYRCSLFHRDGRWCRHHRQAISPLPSTARSRDLEFGGLSVDRVLRESGIPPLGRRRGAAGLTEDVKAGQTIVYNRHKTLTLNIDGKTSTVETTATNARDPR